MLMYGLEHWERDLLHIVFHCLHHSWAQISSGIFLEACYIFIRVEERNFDLQHRSVENRMLSGIHDFSEVFNARTGF
ncbi:hypothetical protein BC937DRAFT_95294 [Endogone sp. FLAS-F59071]|nr:hypothetical protein BC937DRAFT_95294 [Endogone sp. FLAS-F59071]|eukprot:RUS20406.1 hypothetical protein BC937DRAFT_95294 [Endogone sp. FLAS-F59071]